MEKPWLWKLSKRKANKIFISSARAAYGEQIFSVSFNLKVNKKSLNLLDSHRLGDGAKRKKNTKKVLKKEKRN